MSACIANSHPTQSSLSYLSALLGILLTTAFVTPDLLLGFPLGLSLNGELENQSCAAFISVAPASGIVQGTQNSVTLC